MELGRRQVFHVVGCEGSRLDPDSRSHGESPGTGPAPGCSTSSEGEQLEPGSPWLGRELGQSSPRSESEDERSSAMLRMAFSMGARFPLGVMPMGWITFSLQPGGEGEGKAELQQSMGTNQEYSRNVGHVEMAWDTPGTTKDPF